MDKRDTREALKVSIDGRYADLVLRLHRTITAMTHTHDGSAEPPWSGNHSLSRVSLQSALMGLYNLRDLAKAAEQILADINSIEPQKPT